MKLVFIVNVVLEMTYPL